MRRLIHIGGYAVAVWCWTFALVSAAMRFLSKDSPRWSYLSNSSYWLYLAHLPLIFGLQAKVMRWNLHWSVEFSLIMAIAAPILLLSYHYLVRPSWVDLLLNGHRHPRSAQPRITQTG